MDKILSYVGRVLFAIPFLIFGYDHLLNAHQMASMVPSYIPGGIFWIYFTGMAMILAALAILTGQRGRSACFGLALLLLVFIVTIHFPGLSNPQMKMMSMMNLLKDTALMGAALFMAGTFKK